MKLSVPSCFGFSLLTLVFLCLSSYSVVRPVLAATNSFRVDLSPIEAERSFSRYIDNLFKNNEIAHEDPDASEAGSVEAGVSGEHQTHPTGEEEEETIDEEDHDEIEDPWELSDSVNSFEGSLMDLWSEFECSKVFKEQRPIPDHATWMLLRGAYIATVGPQYSTIEYNDEIKDGFLVPVKLDYVPGKGRGVIALEDIPKGTLVWDPLYVARFSSAVDYRRFLASIPSDLACDVMIWAYTETSGDEDQLFTLVSVDLDAGSLMNSITRLEDKNISPSSRAMRNIKAGEELLVDYADFEKDGGWDDFGLI